MRGAPVGRREARLVAVTVPRCLTMATSDSGGGGGIQADLKAFAALGCHGMSAIVALTAQSTTEVRAVHETPPEFIGAQLEVVFDDIGVDAAKTGMLFSAPIIETVAGFVEAHRLPLVVDPVMVAASGAKLLRDDAVSTLVARLLPLATVATPNLHEACALAGVAYSDEANREELAEAIHALGAPAVIVTGGHGSEAVDWLFDGENHVPIPVERHGEGTTHGAGCTHSAALAALLARGASLEEAARRAAEIATEAVRAGYRVGSGSGPVDVLNLRSHGPGGRVVGDSSLRAR
jgi:hydroxymethylpyrimidine kinase/phosphomethylpyrimidine kinase